MFQQEKIRVLKAKGGKIISERETIVLGDGKTQATLFPVNYIDEVHPSLFKFMYNLFKTELELGQTFPQSGEYTEHDFEDYWFHYFCTVLVIGERDADFLKSEHDWSAVFLGTYYIKPNYAGRSSHICNAGFLVSFEHRHTPYKIGTILGKTYIRWAPKLGYTYSVFNLVFETNVGSIRIWENLGFEKIGYVKKAAYIEGKAEPVGAYLFGYEFDNGEKQ